MAGLKLIAILTLAASLVSCLAPPICQSQSIAPNQTALTQVRTANTTSLPGRPFGLVYAAEPGFAFVSLNTILANTTSTLGVLNTTSFPPVLLHEIKLNDTRLKSTTAFGLALTRNGKYVFVSAGTGAYVVSTQKAIHNSEDAVVGILNGSQNVTGDEAIEITLSRDDSHAFVSQEYGAKNSTNGNIDVFKVNYDDCDAISSEHIGHLDLAASVVGSTLSPDGTYLYVTSEVAGTNFTAAALKHTAGILSVIDVKTLTSVPSEAQLKNVTAGCQPVREIVSSDGQFVWVSARASNRLLGFNASALVHDAENALVAAVQVGTEPVGLTFVKNETRIITADSNRYNADGAHTGLTVVEVEAALAGDQNAVMGYIPTGQFPRELALSHDGLTLLVADFASDHIQAIDLTSLP